MEAKQLGLALCAGLLSIGCAGGGDVPSQGDPLEPRLTGVWYWETSKYVSASEYSTLIKTTRTIRINADGTFAGVEESIVVGNSESTQVRRRAGSVTRKGDALVFSCTNGETYTARYSLSGSNGLWLDGVLYQRIQ
jgi:hypothetical protein